MTTLKQLEPIELTIREILTGHVQPRTKAVNTATVQEYPHLNFSNVEHYKEALAYAEKLFAITGNEEALKSFKNCFASLENWSKRDHEPCDVHPDSAPYSFYFRFYPPNKTRGLDGGVILHGCGETFNVELTPKKGQYWSIHT